MPKISAGILTYNRRAEVLDALESVYRQGMNDVEVVVVDSASTDGTAEAVRERYPDAKVIRLPRNLGCPGGRNHVFANCTGDYIVCVDDDGYLGDGSLAALVEAFEEDDSIGIVAMRQRFSDEPEEGKSVGTQGDPIGIFRGGLCTIRRSMLEKIGYYPEDFFLFAEETDLAIRAMNAGYKIVSRPDIIMWHPRIGASSGNRWDYYRFRNSMLVVTRNFPGWLMVKYLFLRLGSYALLSIQRRSVGKYLAAAAYVLWHLPGTLARRSPCSAEAVKAYFRLRGAGKWGSKETLQTREVVGIRG